ncbi:hypothetical protein [Candidatus Endowatersipora endosymbiont of Watersipora subatra]|uniref:hypothetical protein n=1 Tax=Candidatus Endowatersipora endosymbiont of Watersipora subatra TaxID=3077946 RepID=UPI00312C93D7
MTEKKKNNNESIHPIGVLITPIEKTKNLNRLIVLLVIICILLLISDLIVHRHTLFQTEAIAGFYSFFGFCAFSFIIISTKYLKRILGRPEDYYAPHSVDAESYPEADIERKEFGYD